ncbi:DUF3093 domain-containing protein [Corynebacterium hindlerae]|uniref:DUF3093 domain-containing protein n=1 Tax=Corynebacterium hindlerae TaxID=699041 RepID=A0A7G5FFQ4_9CORY|nr:DUF3093 domain-containing protein [Corynebacterium hindlerae]QTH58674.1 DUF3093 domain-containing protein [Corynebacterium hindlerae]
MLLAVSTPGSNATDNAPNVIYREQQWVPWYWWLAGIGASLLTAAQLGHNRSVFWFWIPLIIFTTLALWALWQLSSTVITVEKDADGVTWLTAKGANLPTTVVSRTLAVPATAKRNALGRQLDPAAFVVARSWVPEMAMFVIDDPEDPTPYWLVSSHNPTELLEAFHS